jgi:hypothetical protein
LKKKFFAILTVLVLVFGVLPAFATQNLQTATDGALAWLLRNTEPASHSGWEVTTLARANIAAEGWYANYLSALEAGLGGLSSWTDFQRVTISLTSLGINATNFNGNDLTEDFKNFMPASERPAHSQGINADIFALIALDSGNYSGDRALYLQAILEAQQPSGAWAWGTWESSDITAMAIQALAPYRNDPAVADAIDEGFDFIYNDFIGDAETYAQIIIAYSMLGRDAKIYVDGLLGFRDAATGGFISPWTNAVNEMSTEQAARGLVAYHRFTSGMNNFFSMSDAGASSRTRNILGTHQGGSGDGGGGATVTGQAFISVRNPHANRVFFEGYFNLASNETAFSILRRTNLDVAARGAYVTSINGLAEFNHGATSGWVFRVNGIFPQTSASSVALRNGDRVEWLYTLNLGLDLDDEEFTQAAAENEDEDEEDDESPEEETEKNLTLTLETELATVTFDEEALSALLYGKDDDVTIQLIAEPVIAGEREAISLSVMVDGEVIRNFAGTVLVTLKYTPPEDFPAEFYDLLTVYRVCDNESITELANAKYHNGEISFATKANSMRNGLGRAAPENAELAFSGDFAATDETDFELIRYNWLSLFFISEWLNPFGDIFRDDLFYRDTRFVYSNGLMTGTAAGEFSPNSNLTRAMLVSILWRHEGRPLFENNIFTDVQSGMWYSDAIAWANENKIASGYGGGLFGAHDNVTSEQFAAILRNYSRYRGAESAIDSFPNDTVTRAEAAAILQKFLED